MAGFVGHGFPLFEHVIYLCENSENFELWEVKEIYDETSGFWADRELQKKIRLPKEVGIELRPMPASGEAIDKIDGSHGIAIKATLKNLKSSTIAQSTDLLQDMNELIGCLDIKAYRACLALCGRILEFSLKISLEQNQVPFGDDWMVGKLLKLTQEHGIYTDPGLNNCFNVINKHRISSVHAQDRVPIPSTNQVLMVIHAICDAVDRCLQNKANPNNS